MVSPLKMEPTGHVKKKGLLTPKAFCTGLPSTV